MEIPTFRKPIQKIQEEEEMSTVKETKRKGKINKEQINKVKKDLVEQVHEKIESLNENNEKLNMKMIQTMKEGFGQIATILKYTSKENNTNKEKSQH